MASVLADRLLLSRRDVDITQEDLADQAGNVSAAYISSLERGKVTNPSVDVVAAIAAALGVSPSYLLGWSDAPLAEDAIAQPLAPHIQELIDLFEDLDAPTQQIALDIIRTIRRTQHARVVGA